MEEDQLEWKGGICDVFTKVLRVEEGKGSDTTGFVVNKLGSHPREGLLGSISPCCLKAPSVDTYKMPCK